MELFSAAQSKEAELQPEFSCAVKGEQRTAQKAFLSQLAMGATHVKCRLLHQQEALRRRQLAPLVVEKSDWPVSNGKRQKARPITFSVY